MTDNKTPADRLIEVTMEDIIEALERTLESSEHLLDAIYGKKHANVIEAQDAVNDIEVSKARQLISDYRASKVGDDAAELRQLIIDIRRDLEKYGSIDGPQHVRMRKVEEGQPLNSPPQSVGDDELVERLRKSYAEAGLLLQCAIDAAADERAAWSTQYTSADNYAKDSAVSAAGEERLSEKISWDFIARVTSNLDDAITRLQSQSADPWVKIDNIPEHWKDEVEVWLCVEREIIFGCFYDGDEWINPTGTSVQRGGQHSHYVDTAVYPTHAMLSIAPPQETKTEEG